MAKKKIEKNITELYDEDAIVVKDKDVDKIKERYGMYIGYSGIRAALHLIKEVIQNSIDEVDNGRASMIDGVIEKLKNDYKIMVKDNGSGIPLGKLLECATILQASGKFKKGSKSAYKYAAGMNGELLLF